MTFPHAESAGARAGSTTKFLGWLAFSAMAAMLLSPVSAQSGPMLTGGLTSQPIGHYEFCKHNPQECGVRSMRAAPEAMSDGLWEQIVAINKRVNAAIVPMNDIDIYGQDELWTYPTEGRGDCEDYVLEKRRELAAIGVNLANLLITVVRKPDGEGHAILTVRTNEGDFTLDNLTDAVRDWRETGYRFLKRQSSEDTGRWVAILRGGNPSSTVAALD